jgi:hypothetical protein
MNINKTAAECTEYIIGSDEILTEFSSNDGPTTYTWCFESSLRTVADRVKCSVIEREVPTIQYKLLQIAFTNCALIKSF